MSYVYILKCDDDSYYTGISSDFKRRIREHYFKTRACAKYMRSHNIKELSALWEAPTYSCAARLEYYIKKRLTHSEKSQLIENSDAFEALIPKELQQTYYKRIENITLQDCIEKK